MNRTAAIDRAITLVMGPALAEYAEAQRAFDAGQIDKVAFDPIEKGFRNTLDRRRSQIAEAVRDIMTPAKRHPCLAAMKNSEGVLERCAEAGTTVIDGRSFCAAHAPLVPRKPVPVGQGA